MQRLTLKYLKPMILLNTLGIPCNSTSFMAPLSAAKLHTELVNSNDSKQLETPFVVMLHNVYRM